MLNAFLCLQSGTLHGFIRNVQGREFVSADKTQKKVVVHHDSCFDYGLLVLYLFQRVAEEAPTSTSLFESSCTLPYVRLPISCMAFHI